MDSRDFNISWTDEIMIRAPSATTYPHVRKPGSFNISFGMDPVVAPILKDIGVDAVNLATNHVADRNVGGWLETQKHPKDCGIKWFGTGLDQKTQAEPLIIDTPQGRVGITGVMNKG
jgi:hypothetical protein